MPRWTPIDRARAYAQRYPGAVKSGGGGSDATFALACVLVHGFGLSAQDAYQIMSAEWNAKCSPPWDEKGLLRKANEAATRGGPPAGKAPGYMLESEEQARVQSRAVSRPAAAAVAVEERRQKFDVAALRGRFRPECAEADWWRSISPVRGVEHMGPGEVLDVIFRPGERVLVFDEFRSQGQWIYWVGRGWFLLDKRPGGQARAGAEAPTGGPTGCWWLTNPVDGAWHCQACGYTQPPGGALANRMCPACDPRDWETARLRDELLSRRTWRNLTDYRHLMLEHDPAEGCDKAEHARLWLSFVAQLPLPLMSVTTSGGKSVHAVFRLPARGSKAEFDRLLHVAKRHLERFGADPAAMRSVQLTRLPNVERRDKGARQELLYLDPDPDPECSVLERLGVGLSN